MTTSSHRPESTVTSALPLLSARSSLPRPGGGRLAGLVLSAVLPLGWSLGALPAAAAPREPAAGSASEFGAPSTQRVGATGPLQLRVRRLPDSVEVMIEGTGPAPVLQQYTNASGWEGQLSLSSPSGLAAGPQRFSLPEAGLASISLEGADSRYWIQVSGAAGVSVPRPVVSADGRNLILSFPATPQLSTQTGRLDLNTPGRVPQPLYAPPLQPRAAAPPVGDMAVGSMVLRNRSYVNVSGPPVTMTLRNAPARDALMALSQLGGYGFVYVDGNGSGPPAQATAVPPVSIAFRGESFSRAINAVLLASGLQGRVEGNMILAGPNVLAKTFGSQLSKVYRLNQVSANSAADYLASLGATINKTFTTTSTSSEVSSTGTPANNTAASTATTATTTQINSFGASQGPLVGLIGTTDSRLGTITLVGEAALVSVAEKYLRQLDLRQRQVALAVRILDVNLENIQEIDNSFAIRWGNNFIVNDSGQLLGAFGRYLPPGAEAFSPSNTTEVLGRTSASFNSNEAAFTLDSGRSFTSGDISRIERELRGRADLEITDSGRTLKITGSDAFSLGRIRQAQSVIERVTGRSVTAESGNASNRTSQFTGTRARNPGRLYPSDNFFDFIDAQITSRNAKLLASPTLILQENPSLLREGAEGGGGGSSSGQNQGLDAYTIDSPIGRRRANEGAVRVGTNVITNVDVTQQENGGTQCELELSTAGLTLGARIEKIDDNGFVTFSLSPSVSAVTDTVPGPPSCTSQISILSVRRLDTGALRVRDGQTLILTGVISDFDVAEVSKWPILGDLPLVGQFFRASSNQREKRELVIMVTPRIINDDGGGTFGYGYQPSTQDARQFLGAPQ